jgi:hypothetical protein
LSRARFDRFFANRATCRIVMEACGSAHHHARRLSSQGHSVVAAGSIRARLRPAQQDRCGRRRCVDRSFALSGHSARSDQVRRPAGTAATAPAAFAVDGGSHGAHQLPA